MRLSCPACQAETSLEVLLGREVDARAVAGFIERNVVFGELMVRYIALFRPPKRRLGLARMVALIEELLPDIQRGAINRKSRDWPAPKEHWREAMETVLGKRDRDSLTLPLTTHGLLLEVLVGMAEKYEARAESQREEERRTRRPAGAVQPPRDLSALAQDIAASPVAPSAATLPLYQPGPSRAAQAIKAQIEEHQQRRRGDTGAQEGQP